MIRSLFSVVALALGLPVLAQSPYLVADLNSTISDSTSSSSPLFFVAEGSTVFFSATTPGTGRELWKVTGNGPAELVRDIVPGSGGSDPWPLVPLGGGVFLFSATDAAHGRELWRTDGTLAGTVLLKDINPAGDAVVSVDQVVGGVAYLTADDGVHGRELWSSDGTEAGTQLLIDFNGTSASSSPGVMVPFGNRSLISAAGGLWSTDRTPGGTTLVMAGVLPRTIRVVGAIAFFIGYDVAHGYELWKTDGTPAGTERITDIAPGPLHALQSSSSTLVPISGGRIVFLARDDQAWRLWVSDGTVAGTQPVGAALSTCFPCSPQPPKGALGLAFFHDASGLWRTDGTAAGTYVVDAQSSSSVAAFSRVYSFSNGPGTLVIKATDGTLSGTSTVATLPGYTAWQWAFTGGRLFFSLLTFQSGEEPWVSEDGTAAGTHLLANVAPDAVASSMPRSLTAGTDQLFFRAKAPNSPDEVWRTDGTAGGTRQVTNLAQTGNGTSFDQMTAFNNALYVRQTYAGVLRSDGTAAGTGPFGSLRADAMFAGSRLLYLNASTTPIGTSHFPVAWRSDGTLAGTFPLDAGARWAADVPESPQFFAELAGRVYFRTAWTQYGFWQTEGTPETTKRLWKFDSSSDVYGFELMSGAGALFLSNSTPESGRELWRTDGTEAGMMLVKDIAPGTDSSSPQSLTAAGAYVFFTATDPLHGTELWRTDGTAAGTILMNDIRSGPLSSAPANLRAAGDLLLFTADDGTNGVELWRSDGTEAGTVMVRDIAPGPASSTPSSLGVADGSIWFAADNASNGRELWRSDGSSAGTTMVADLNAGSASSDPAEMTQVGRTLFFRANDGVTGHELWALPLTGSVFSIQDVRIVEGTGGTKALRLTVTRSGDLTGPASVAFGTADGSATSGADYSATSGTLAFGPAEAVKFIDVSITGDTAIEQNEAFFVLLSSPTGATLARPRATGVIEDDDRRAELTVEATAVDFGRVSFLITNAGPSPATDVRLRSTISPGLQVCDACTYPVDSIAAGASRTVTIDLPTSPSMLTDPLRPTGITVSATVTAVELDSNLEDNTTSTMFSADGRLRLPPFLRTNQSSTARYVTPYSRSAALASSPSIVAVTPPYVGQPAFGIDATFQLKAGATTGWTTMTATDGSGYATRVMLPVVGPVDVAKQNVGITNPFVQSIYSQPLQIPVTVAAQRHDGRRPTGTLTLLDASGAAVALSVLDSTASVVFTRTGLPVGTYRHSVQYSGDAFFEPATVDLGWSRVDAIPTTVTLTLTRTGCTLAEGLVTVRATTGPAPTGSVRILSYSTGQYVGAVSLVPTGQAGESAAVVRLTIGRDLAQFSAEYAGSATQATSSGFQYLSASECADFATRLYLITPCRVFDSRNSGPASANSAMTVNVTGVCGIPAGAAAAAANITVIQPSAAGWMSFAPAGVLPVPNVSTINYRAARVRGNNSILALPSDGKVTIYNSGPPVHFIVDITAYFR